MRTTYPWKVTIGDHAWVGDNVVLYSLGEIVIGANAVVSQNSYLCAGAHDYTRPDFPIFAKPVRIEAEAWLAADVFVAPGVTVGRGAVVGSRSSVFTDLPPMMVCFGSPAKPIRPRIAEDATKLKARRPKIGEIPFTTGIAMGERTCLDLRQYFQDFRLLFSFC